VFLAKQRGSRADKLRLSIEVVLYYLKNEMQAENKNMVIN